MSKEQWAVYDTGNYDLEFYDTEKEAKEVAAMIRREFDSDDLAYQENVYVFKVVEKMEGEE